MLRTNRIIKTIDLISSSTCNMNCLFCYLHKNDSYRIMNDEVLKALDNGEYFDTCKKVIEKVNGNVNDLVGMAFWGGETTLYIDKIGKHVDKLFKNFPNLNRFFLSTNMTTPASKILSFVKDVIDKLPEGRERVKFSFLASIDGPEGLFTLNGHPGTYDVYTKNFIDFFNGIESMINTLKNKMRWILINLNSTIDKKLYFDTFLDYDKALAYYKFMYTYIKMLNEYTADLLSYITVRGSIPGIALPFDATTKDGYKYTECLKIIDKVHNSPEIKALYTFSEELKFWRGFPGFVLDDSICSTNYECGQYAESLTILPSGRVVECNGSYIDSFLQYQEELLDKKEYAILQNALIASKLTYNPLEMDEYEIERINRTIVSGYRNTNFIYDALKFGLVKEMALSHQVPFEYSYDKELRSRHMQILNKYFTCSRENIRDNHTPYLGVPDLYRLALNGAVQYVYQGIESAKRKANTNGEKYSFKPRDFYTPKRYNRT